MTGAAADHTGAALITGAGKRLGRAMALALAQDGYDLGIHVHTSLQAGHDMADKARATGVKAAVLQANLANREAVNTLVHDAMAELGPLGVLINNASVFDDDRWDTVSDESWDEHMQVNLHTPFLLAQNFAHACQARSRGGVIVNVLDQRVWKPTPQFMSYSLSKAGLWWLTRTLAQALGPLGIRVVGIGPGPTLRNPRQDAADFEAQGAATPLKRSAEPDDIVQTLRYILRAKSLTGQMIAVDAGQHLIWQTPDTQVSE
jgi:NAD(P)-dependent dehydrogenase (short-subunit alcohol dehydrogenase family)